MGPNFIKKVIYFLMDAPHMVMPSGQSHKSHFEIDFTRKSEFLSFIFIFSFWKW